VTVLHGYQKLGRNDYGLRSKPNRIDDRLIEPSSGLELLLFLSGKSTHMELDTDNVVPVVRRGHSLW